MKQLFYFKFILLSLLMVVMGLGNAYADKYQLYSGEITEGDYILVSPSSTPTAMNTTVDKNRLQFQAVEVKDGIITRMNNHNTDLSSVVWKIKKSGDYYTLYNVSADKYAASTGKENQAQLLADGTNDMSLWTITGTETYEFVNKKNAALNINKNLRKNSSYGFACYSTKTGNALSLYKKVIESPLASITVDGVTPTPTFYVGDTFVFGGTVTATYENGDTKDVTKFVKFSEPDMTTAGSKEVTVSYTEGEVTKTATYTITVNALTGDYFTLVTKVSDLRAGDKVIIVNTEASKAISTTQNTNNRGAVEVIIQNNKILVPNTGEIQIFTLKGNVTDGWYFYTGSGYIYAAGSGSGKNYLRTETEKDENGNSKASISISNQDATVQFQGTNTNNLLKYNSNSDLYSCYSSGQKNVQIYRRVYENGVDVTISDVGYSTLYYGDRALTVPEGVTATTYSVTDGKLTESKKYDAGMTIPKGEAVVLKGAAGKYRFAAASTAEEVDVNNKLKGSDSAEETTGGTLYYALTLNKQNDPKSVGFYWMNETGTAFTNGAHKAYLALDGSLGGGAQAKSSYLFSEATTGIKGAENVAHDAIQEGYNLNGQRVSQGYRGIVIVNGRKYIAK